MRAAMRLPLAGRRRLVLRLQGSGPLGIAVLLVRVAVSADELQLVDPDFDGTPIVPLIIVPGALNELA